MPTGVAVDGVGDVGGGAVAVSVKAGVDVAKGLGHNEPQPASSKVSVSNSNRRYHRGVGEWRMVYQKVGGKFGL